MGLDQIAQKIGLNSIYLANMAWNADKFYKCYYVKKSSGNLRQIEAPSKHLKAVQRWILKTLLENIVVSDRAHGFVKKRNISSHASYHIAKKYILSIDIMDFFPSIKKDQVEAIFRKIVDNDDSKIYASLCTFKRRLPQGAATSPALSNIAFQPVDNMIKEMCNRKDIAYSRYADDITFSSNDLQALKQLYPEIAKLIGEAGYRLNKAKTRYSSGRGKLLVTGLRLNSGRLTVGRARKRKIRAALYNYIIKEKKTTNEKHVFGNIAFIMGIEPDYREKITVYVKNLQQKKGP